MGTRGPPSLRARRRRRRSALLCAQATHDASLSAACETLRAVDRVRTGQSLQGRLQPHLLDVRHLTTNVNLTEDSCTPAGRPVSREACLALPTNVDGIVFFCSSRCR